MSKEVVYWQENEAGRVFLSHPAAEIHPGYMLKSTNKPGEMNKIFRKIHEQEREHNEKLIEKTYARGKEYNDILRSRLRSRMNSAGVSSTEKDIIRESLRLMDEKEFKMRQNTVYGVSAMEESPEPLPARNTRVM